MTEMLRLLKIVYGDRQFAAKSFKESFKQIASFVAGLFDLDSLD
jgi:hypothetical protein